MSGHPWTKLGTFTDPVEAGDFLSDWWRKIAMPMSWRMRIDGHEYEGVGYNFRDRIAHCYDMHRAFYG